MGWSPGDVKLRCSYCCCLVPSSTLRYLRASQAPDRSATLSYLACTHCRSSGAVEGEPSEQSG